MLLLALGGGWGARGVAAEPAMREPLNPAPSSLAPVDTESFRQRYGQEALFRLKLGVEAGEGATTWAGAPPACGNGWARSTQAQRFLAEVNQHRWYEAGQMLGEWRRGCGGH